MCMYSKYFFHAVPSPRYVVEMAHWSIDGIGINRLDSLAGNSNNGFKTEEEGIASYRLWAVRFI